MVDENDVGGYAESYMTLKSYTKRAQVERTACDVRVPPAADSIIGHCEYYYRPLHCTYTETVEKVTASSAWATVKAFATSWDPWTDKEVAARLLHQRQTLIQPDCTASDWSRHSNFMMRHIGCGHRPPAYYLSYGYYYCSSYGAKLKPTLSKAGRDWLDNARWYLQIHMEKGLALNMTGDVIKVSSAKPGNGSFRMGVKQYGLELDNETFKSFAFKTHPLAYLDGGLAHLQIGDMAKIMGGPALEEWGDRRTYEQVWDSGKVVASKTVGDAWSATKDDIDDPVSKALGRLMGAK
ncbi:hypothetical protein PPGU19_074110 (plasmid) [Paraburkholderia sp. PGU19]|uniref:hypothetical protein n=1 Tax=Paraburkholderia sp. PGU19 TaxID=2735434 RepID=UPI0015D9B1D2|nr:hypothetical protein [Paraburkholderia sp. PGU19]BCG02843.1 hypothetical protein PPGU19_074110 [Paraburkholderia sp. PGU19]